MQPIGSDETYVTAIPYPSVTYNNGQYSASLSLTDGLSVMYNMPEKHLMASIKINGGGERDSEKYSLFIMLRDHSADVQRLLEGTPSVGTSVESQFKLDYESPIGILGCSIEYHPTTVEGALDRFYNGFVFAAEYAIAIPVTEKIAVMGMAGISLMDQNYADAWFSLENSTQRLEAFNASAGFRDFQLSMQLQYDLFENFGLMVLSKNAWLLGDARDSPFTRSRHQMTWAVFGVYNF